MEVGHKIIAGCVFSNNVMYFTILTLLALVPDMSTLEENFEKRKRTPEREKEEQQVEKRNDGEM